MCFNKKKEDELNIELEDLEYEVGKMLERQKNYKIINKVKLMNREYGDMIISEDSVRRTISHMIDFYPYGLPVFEERYFKESYYPNVTEAIGFSNHLFVEDGSIYADITMTTNDSKILNKSDDAYFDLIWKGDVDSEDDKVVYDMTGVVGISMRE